MFAGLLFGQGLLVDTTALAAVALLGYLFGRQTRRPPSSGTDVTLLIEFARAQCVAKDLEHLSRRLRTEVNGQLTALAAFQGQIERMQSGAVTADWRQLRQHADALMAPTMSLACSLSLACDEIRDQQSQLMTFADARVDRETGVLNRRAMLDHLHALLATRSEGNRRLTVVLCSLDIDPYSSPDNGAGELPKAARLIEQYCRGNDVVARYGPQEFVIILSRMTLDAGLIIGERILKVVDASLERRAWGSVAQSEADESPEELLARAESALRAAAKEEVPTLFIHDGMMARRHQFELCSIHAATPALAEVDCYTQSVAGE
jgi:diguanylate cyclase (GGDEF)-like protein